jgi:hypothetical protein
VRYIIGRAALVVAHVVGILAYHRFALYPSLVDGGLGVRPRGLALYPGAALMDWALGTQIRLMLSGS